MVLQRSHTGHLRSAWLFVSGEVFWIWHSHHEKSIISNEISFPSHTFFLRQSPSESFILCPAAALCQKISHSRDEVKREFDGEALLLERWYNAEKVFSSLPNKGHKIREGQSKLDLKPFPEVPESSCERGFWPS